MKIAFCYPPFTKNGRTANLTQNRQFIYTTSPEVRIFPVVMATAATWLADLTHEVLWLDGITKRLSLDEFNWRLNDFKPELMILETKAPLMPEIWKYIREIKKKTPNLKFVLVGDHSTLLPEQSFEKSPVDFVLTGGDYDFLLVNLVNHLVQGKKLEPGIYFRESAKDNRSGGGLVKSSGKYLLSHKLDLTPVIDRGLTCWKDYGEAYLLRPCAYMMFGRGCGISSGNNGVCSFCIWQHALWGCTARLRSPEHVVLEVKNLVRLGVKEVFDDAESGALADYNWLMKFYQLLKKEKLLGKITFSSNARGDQLNKKTCRLLKKLNYRLLKVGLESGNDITLLKIAKKETVEQVIRGVRTAKDQGLRVMLTVMVGYPWESVAEVRNTLEVTRELMFYKTRAGDCLQASVVTPYPGTPLWQQSQKFGWFSINSEDLRKYDMGEPILKSPIDSRYWCSQIWAVQKDIRFIVKSGLSVKRLSEVALLLRGGKSLLGHIKDYATFN